MSKQMFIYQAPDISNITVKLLVKVRLAHYNTHY